MPLPEKTTSAAINKQHNCPSVPYRPRYRAPWPDGTRRNTARGEKQAVTTLHIPNRHRGQAQPPRSITVHKEHTGHDDEHLGAANTTMEHCTRKNNIATARCRRRARRSEEWDEDFGRRRFLLFFLFLLLLAWSGSNRALSKASDAYCWVSCHLFACSSTRPTDTS